MDTLIKTRWDEIDQVDLPPMVELRLGTLLTCLDRTDLPRIQHRAERAKALKLLRYEIWSAIERSRRDG